LGSLVFNLPLVGEVIDIDIHKTGYVKILHKHGWEKGYKIKGKWSGFYECIGILRESDITFYAKGYFNKGKRIGIWEISYIYHNRDKPIKIQVGNYSNGKKEGVWKTIIFGQTITKHSWNKGDL
tara:strand:- start:93 stop:464 length:372 start_codon:yes stop_codon:yes gene_type:complete